MTGVQTCALPISIGKDEVRLLTKLTRDQLKELPSEDPTTGIVPESFKEVLDRLKEKYEIIIISMGACPNLFGKEIWIKDNLPSTKFIGIDMKKHKDKSHVDMSGAVLIDDEKRYLDSSNAKMKICFGEKYEWNECWKGIRCFNWAELENYLMKGSEHE